MRVATPTTVLGFPTIDSGVTGPEITSEGVALKLERR